MKKKIKSILLLLLVCIFLMGSFGNNTFANDTQNEQSKETHEVTEHDDSKPLSIQQLNNEITKSATIDINTEDELKNALSNVSSNNQILVLKNDIILTKTMAMKSNLNVTIDGGHFTVTRGVGGFLFTVPNNSGLKLTNITINGKKESTFASKKESLIQVNGGNLILSTDVVLENNRAENDWGGAVNLRGSLDNSVTMEYNSLIRNCEAKNGGAIYGGKQGSTAGYGKVDIIVKDNAQILNNYAYGNDAVSSFGNGGAIAVSEPTNLGIVNMDIKDNALISNNKAHGYGGAIYSVLRNPDSKINIDNATISNNNTFSNISTNSGGGAMYLTIENGGAGATININNANITNNTTGNATRAGLGGGIYLRYVVPTDNVSIKNSNISKNLSNEGSGAGIYFQMITSETVSASLTNNTISENKVDAVSKSIAGAGVYVNAAGKAKLDFNGTSITNNILSSTGETKGAGIYLHTSNEVAISNVSINQHSANKGAAIYSNSNLYLDNALIENNLATAEGGGIYSNSTISVTNSLIKENQAKNGAAFYSNKASSISSSIMKDNKASVNGGAIYNGGILELKENDIQSNSGIKGAGIYNKGTLNLFKGNIINSLYILDAAAVPVVQEELINTTIQLEESPHVTSTNKSTPIIVAVNSTGYSTLNTTDKNAFIKPIVNFDKHVNLLSDTILTASNKDSEVWLYYGLYNVDYKMNGGTNSLENPSFYAYGAGVDTFKKPTKAGYDFIGWYDTALFINKITDVSKTSQGDVSLHAKWKASEYSISYELDGGENNSNNPTSYIFGIGVNSFGGATRQGYTFVGWYDDASFTNEIIDISNTSTEDVKLYAKWKVINYTIDYELNNGINDESNPDFYVYAVGIPTFNDATKIGYTFVGWYDDTLFTNKITNISDTATDDITLYAKWEPIKYKINYELDGGINNSKNPNYYTIEKGVSTFYEPKKEGYEFVMWVNDEGEEITAIPENMVGDIVVHAVWKKIDKISTITNPMSNPSIKGNDVIGNSTALENSDNQIVKTSDSTNSSLLMFVLLLSGYVVKKVKKRSKSI